ncbi:AraC family transcriptional regulator [Nonomuraea sp. NPDC050404]|uniref:AraC family transcriptional regulator n=1 Tax=Nonomuraea sp. NPDC050404 TaxID=3155783 RepID=UPI0033F3C3B7
MDPYDDLLKGVRGEGSVLGVSSLSPPWALRHTAAAPLTLCIPMRGAGWLIQGDVARRVEVGESAIVRGPEPFVFADTESPGSVLDVRAEGADGDLDAHTVLLTGSYELGGEVTRRLIGLLPPVIVMAEDYDCSSIREYLDIQLRRRRPGYQIVLDRLLDWLLVCVLRDWFDRPEARAPRWYHALADDVAGPALRAIHEAPAAPWTLASLAARAGVSRTTLAKRFTDAVGEPPLAYLTGWRMALAADLLVDREATVASVARRVGYADAFGFSAAFKRVKGVSPSAFRKESPAARAG